MVTPFDAAGGLDLDAAQHLAAHLVDQGTTAWSSTAPPGSRPTTTDAEKDALLRAVSRRSATGPTSSPGSAPTTPGHTDRAGPRRPRRPARTACSSSRRTTTSRRRPGCCAHFTAVADATDLPVMLYDIPGRTGVPIATETLLRLAEHPRIVAVKDAKGDLVADVAGAWRRTDLAYYCGDDALNLPWLARRRGRLRQRRRPRGRPTG